MDQGGHDIHSRTHASARPFPSVSSLKTFVLLAVLGLVAAVGSSTAAAASASAPCWKALINDWYDGRIDNVYPVHCYREALAHLPEDVQTYSSARDDINRALQARLAGGPGGGRNGGPGSNPPSTSGRETGTGPVNDAIGSLGPKDATSVPIPLIVLAGVAFLLLAAGSVGFFARRMQSRKVQIRPPDEQPS